MDPSIERRLNSLLEHPSAMGLPPAEVEYLLAAGYAQALRLDGERLKLQRRIAELASSADDAHAAEEMRVAWSRQRALRQELQGLRGVLEHVRHNAPESFA